MTLFHTPCKDSLTFSNEITLHVIAEMPNIELEVVLTGCKDYYNGAVFHTNGKVTSWSAATVMYITLYFL